TTWTATPSTSRPIQITMHTVSCHWLCGITLGVRIDAKGMVRVQRGSPDMKAAVVAAFSVVLDWISNQTVKIKYLSICLNKKIAILAVWKPVLDCQRIKNK